MDSKTLIGNLQEWLHLKNHTMDDTAAVATLPPELFSTDQMESHGFTLAMAHELTQKPCMDMLLKRLSQSAVILDQSYASLSHQHTAEDGFSPASEWLLDNFYLIQEQILIIRRNLPKGYGRELPQLSVTQPGYPRIYDIALQIIEHGDGRWDLENLTRLIAAYQRVTPLTLGELWAIPITLGVALIENLSRASVRIVADRDDRNLADYWAAKMIEVAAADPKKLVIVIADMARAEPRMTSAFVAELTRRLQGAALALPLSWIEQHLADEELSIEQLVQEENTHQAANQISVSNSIASLRRLTEVDWRDFVEDMSVVNQTLMHDPAAIYSNMDFGTRDRYRHVIEHLAKKSLLPEERVAASAIELAEVSAIRVFVAGDTVENIQQRHVGYYLIGAGLSQLQNKLGVQLSWWQRVRRLVSQHALFAYAGSIVVVTAGFVSALLLWASQDGASLVWLLVLGVVMALFSSQIAVHIVNLAATLLVKPRSLARLDFSKGIPSASRTLVVVPAIIANADDVEALIEALEVRFLGNRDNNLHFGLLTDFNDADHEHMPEDAALVSLAEQGIQALNQQYKRDDNDIFFLFHRPRQWNPTEQVWMGAERKRGKLSDLNNLLRENIQTGFSLIVGTQAIFNSIKYVITLDTDTQLSRESARQYIGTMAHPLNRPRFDADKQCVIDGYTILQPRIAEALSDRAPTRYLRLYGNEFGIDPYTRTVSDVYQDVFHEGSFIGKGIYDVDIFQKILKNRFPDNRILSHDLLEGCYLGSGYLSDVPLYEQSPHSYLADVKRRSRWIRGDWQLVGWLQTTVLNGENQRVKNPLSGLSKLKIIDNLRRSLVPAALLLFLILSLTLLSSDSAWMLIILGLLVLPEMIKTGLDLTAKPKDMLLNQYVANIFQSLRRRAGQLIFTLACLPHEAYYSIEAIFRTCWRMLVSKRHLLEWTPSSQVEQRLQNSPAYWLANMWMGPLLATVMFVVLFKNSPDTLRYAVPLLALWFFSPILAGWLSKPVHKKEIKLDSKQIAFLRKMARKTWNFFDTFIKAEDHWLPPDNFQELPVEVVARRTSPTNIGLSLLANLTAYDFGYINIPEVLERTANTLETVSNLEKYHGHLYNWYSTETLAPLLPRYVSTVDSGNLAGHLLTLRQGLLMLTTDPLLNIRYIDGLEDTFDILVTKPLASLPDALKNFHQLLNDARTAFSSWSTALSVCNRLCDAAALITLLFVKPDDENRYAADWVKKLVGQCNALRDEIKRFACLPGLSVNASLNDIANQDSSKITFSPAQKETQQQVIAEMALIDKLAQQAFSLAQMDIHFLYDEASHLMTIGFNVEESRRDSSSYDLLSSEARLGCFVAIAQGQILQESWFALGRLLISSGGEPILVSWSGSMFEYLMPMLVMPSYPHTLLDQSCQGAVKRQIAYGKQRGVAWGVSESGFNAVDTQFNYLYRAFGVPGLGLKRGLEDDLVIAPYASVMALMVAPEAACLNLQRLAAEFTVGRYGFYEAIDFTESRLPRDSKRAMVHSFMAHHQGMSFLAYSYLLHDQPMQKRFVADPLFQSALLLLQERTPKPTASYLQIPSSPKGSGASHKSEASMRVFNSANTRTPQIQLLSNGRYHVVLTQAGGGYSRWNDIALTRWREDSTCDDWGLFSYIRDVSNGHYCSTSYQPTGDSAKSFKAVFSESHVEFNRTEGVLDMHTEVVVSPEDDIEIRRLRIHNRSKMRRTIEFTSYGEIVLTQQAADQSQAAFSNLFVETEILSQQRAILATRRPQDHQQDSPWLCHLLNVYGGHNQILSFETDRNNFVGRGGNLAAPRALLVAGDLSNTQGAVLDPVMAIRCRVTLDGDAMVMFDLLTGVTDNREHCVALVEKYQDRRLANRIFGLAWTHSQVLLHHLNMTQVDAQLYGRLASAVIYTSSTRRADPRVLVSNRRGQSGLWGYSISGDLPIILLRIEDAANIDLVRRLIQAQAYWRRKGLLVDLVILNEERISYRQDLQEQIVSLTASAATTDHAGTIVVRIAEQVPVEDRNLFDAVARVIISDKQGTLKEQLGRRRAVQTLVPLLSVSNSPRNYGAHQLPLRQTDLQFFNGLGGFSPDGDEYIIRLREGVATPAPWVNVLANPVFGTLVSESGQAYTWIENCHEFRLTPWDNDPIEDTSGEAFYLRDEESGVVWSPTALPCRGRGDYEIRHGFGYSVFEHVEEGIHSEMWMYVALDAPVKFVVLKIRNDSLYPRRLSATGYVSWVLGDLRVKNAMHVITEISQRGALLAVNHYNTEFGERTAFFDAITLNAENNTRTTTCDRAEFIGRNGTLRHPAALKRQHLSGRSGAGLDPCGAIQSGFDLAKGQSREIVFILGAGKNRETAEALLQRFYGVAAAQVALASTRQFWQQKLKGLRVETPDPALNLLANGWLIYQVLSSRLWGRSGYYQSGGAFGFRDQLQDVMSLTHISPDLFRAQIILCAAHQFEEGDVQHWWHPPSNRGVRTRCSDDYLWLPFAICHYIQTTGDKAVLDEKITFLQGRPLKADEESYYELPVISNDTATLYQHAVRAIKNGLKFGVHGLPLMGSGDWNDGMNMVGKDGKGESVWLGFFLYSVLKNFAPLAVSYGDTAFAAQCDMEREKLQKKIEEHAWDGEWYRRAYFDDGTPLGSSCNNECRIDSIAQSWSVLSGAADPVRARQALQSLYKNLVCADEGLVKLLDPPFDTSMPNPGYIEGYLPGIRENGGQYTHGAVWAAMAFAEIGEKQLAWQVFNILNPVNHGRTAEEIQRYKIEPYVIAGDVYSVAPHTGRGGWSWYTGSAGWLYRLITETLLGLNLEEGTHLRLAPHVPAEWKQFSVDYEYGKTLYKISVSAVAGEAKIMLDDVVLTEGRVALIDDGKVHQITMSVSIL
jgi:cyclic beta-1,2-glucan synthetase